MTQQTVTVIVPAYNAAATIGDCLKAISQLTHAFDQLIVYVDGATDNTDAIARAAGATVIVNSGKPRGPSGGRNEAAAAASSEYVLFVDADVIIAPEALAIMLADLNANDAVAAFGSYDQAPRSTRIASFYANLRHHHVHQNSARDASTFWTGMGLMRRDIFLGFGGFDVAKFPYPSIEDVELGMRIVAQGYRIRLVPEALSKHCKDWTVGNVWHTDIARRAYLWSCLLIDGKGKGQDLNVDRAERLIAMLAVGTVGIALLSTLEPMLLIPVAVLFALYIFLNRSFFSLLLRVLGFPKVLGAIAMHFCYHLYATGTYIYTLVITRLGWRKPDRDRQSGDVRRDALGTRAAKSSSE